MLIQTIYSSITSRNHSTSPQSEDKGWFLNNPSCQVEKYTAEMLAIMDTHDENGDGKFEMSELAMVLKLEDNFLEKIIRQKSVTDKQIKVNLD